MQFSVMQCYLGLFLGEGWPCVIFERRPGLGSAKCHPRTRLQTLARICSRVSAELWCDNHSIILNPTWFYYDRLYRNKKLKLMVRRDRSFIRLPCTLNTVFRAQTFSLDLNITPKMAEYHFFRFRDIISKKSSEIDTFEFSQTHFLGFFLFKEVFMLC